MSMPTIPLQLNAQEIICLMSFTRKYAGLTERDGVFLRRKLFETHAPEELYEMYLTAQDEFISYKNGDVL